MIDLGCGAATCGTGATCVLATGAEAAMGSGTGATVPCGLKTSVGVATSSGAGAATTSGLATGVGAVRQQASVLAQPQLAVL